MNLSKECAEYYKDTRRFLDKEFQNWKKYGFQIFYGPPMLQPDILFIGYQPGRGVKSPEEERVFGSEDRWPEKSEYLTETWRLAINLRQMFGEEKLQKCVGMNAIFVRADSIQLYEDQVSKDLRDRIKDFCVPRVEAAVRAIRPKVVLAIGFRTLELFGSCAEGIRSPSANAAGAHRILTKTGTIADQEAIGTLHLSGARLSSRDRKAIGDYILARTSAN